MNKMTSRERLLAALSFKETDRMPFAPLIDDYFITSLPKQGYNMDILEAMRFLDIDFMERHVPAVKTIYRNGVEYSETLTSGIKICRFDTPIGSITQDRPIGISQFAVSKHFIKDEEDIRIFKYVAANTDYIADEERFAARQNQIGDAGLATPSGPMSPFQEISQFGTGLENAVYYMMDYEDEMKDLLTVMHERNMRCYRELVKTSAPVIIDYEDTSTTTLSRSLLENYSIPYIEDYNKIVQDSGKIFIAHMCGKLTGFINQINQLNVNGIDSLCPPNTGDLCCWNARNLWGDRKVIIGGIDPVSLAMEDVPAVLDSVTEIICRMPDKRGFILSTGDATAHGTPIANIVSVVKFIHTLGDKALLPEVDEDYVNHVKQGVLKDFGF